MKKNLIVLVILCVGIHPVWSQVPEGENSSEDVQRIIEEKNAQLEKWYAGGELDSVVSVFAVDVIQMPPHHEPIKPCATIGNRALNLGSGILILKCRRYG